MPGTDPPHEPCHDESDESLMRRYGTGDLSAFDTLYARHELGVWRYLLRHVRQQEVADDLAQDVWFAVVRQAANYEPGGRSAGPPQARPAPLGGREPHEVGERGGNSPAGPPQARPAPSGGREPHEVGERGGNSPAGPPQARPARSGGSALHEVKSVGATFKTWLFTIAHNRFVDHFRTVKNHASLDADPGQGDATLADTLAADSGFGPVRQLQSQQQASALIAAVEALPHQQRNAFLLQAEGGMSVDDIARVTGASFETTKSRLRYARSQLRLLLKELA